MNDIPSATVVDIVTLAGAGAWPAVFAKIQTLRLQAFNEGWKACKDPNHPLHNDEELSEKI